jgi:hypothetical protein
MALFSSLILFAVAAIPLYTAADRMSRWSLPGECPMSQPADSPRPEVSPTPDAHNASLPEEGDTLLTPPGAPLPTAAVTGALGRYRPTRFHARGGLGEVHVATDVELQRDVALKQLRPDRADDAGYRQRFILEAEVTGRLEHPGVVPVYGLGAYPDGRPYYAMRFIKGETLEAAIDAFHKADKVGRDPGERSLALRELLRRFVDVCNAVGYAHSAFRCPSSGRRDRGSGGEAPRTGRACQAA